jgi:hypothetical protein
VFIDTLQHTSSWYVHTIWQTGAIAAEQRKANSYSTNGSSSNGKQSNGHNNGPRLSPAVYEMVLEQLLSKHVRYTCIHTWFIGVVHVYTLFIDTLVY